MGTLENDWAPLLDEEFQKPYFKSLREELAREYRTFVIYPEERDIYNAFHFTPFHNTKVVIIGQDPYHGPGQAHGLSFSVKTDVRIPPSLKNIYKELHSDVGFKIPNHGCLENWARQGVLLLNSVLTVRDGQPNSHRGLGWEKFTDKVIETINQGDSPVVFILWGSFAQQKEKFISNPKHLIIKSPHPSPLSASRGFFGSRPFSRTNAFLLDNGRKEIDWQIPDIQ